VAWAQFPEPEGHALNEIVQTDYAAKFAEPERDTFEGNRFKPCATHVSCGTPLLEHVGTFFWEPIVGTCGNLFLGTPLLEHVGT